MNPKIKTLIIAALLGGSLFAVFRYSHINVFPCTKTESRLNKKNFKFQVTKLSSSCSLLGVSRRPFRDDDGTILSNQELQVIAYPMIAILFIGFPLWIGRKIAYRNVKRERTDAPPESPGNNANA